LVSIHNDILLVTSNCDGSSDYTTVTEHTHSMAHVHSNTTFGTVVLVQWYHCTKTTVPKAGLLHMSDLVSLL